jgi:type IV pilus assembly protein PilA
MKTLQQGFSLIELLVVIAIIGILAAVGTTGYNAYIDGAKSKTAQANLDTIVTTLTNEDMAVSAGVSSPNSASCGDKVKTCVTAILVNNTSTNPYGGDYTIDTSVTVVAATALTCGTADTPDNNGEIEIVVDGRTVTSFVCLAGTLTAGPGVTLSAMNGAV